VCRFRPAKPWLLPFDRPATGAKFAAQPVV
jgi:hypothetical protein